jgi:hypothetical protein
MKLLIRLLVLVLLIGLVWWAGTTLIAAFGLPAPAMTVFVVLVVVIAVIAMLRLFGLVEGDLLK